VRSKVVDKNIPEEETHPPMPEPSETDELPELPVEGDESKAAAQSEVPDFAEIFGSLEPRKPSEWQKICAQYCAGSVEYMKVLMRRLLTAKDEQRRSVVMADANTVITKLRELRRDMAGILKEATEIRSEIDETMNKVAEDFQKAAGAVTKETGIPKLKKESPALAKAKELITSSAKSHSISDTLHAKNRWTRLGAVMSQRAKKRRQVATRPAANHTQELDSLGEALPTGDDTGQGQVVVFEDDLLKDDLPEAKQNLPAVKPPARTPKAKTAKPEGETRTQFALRWTGNLASVGIAPAIRAGLRARARKKSQ